MANTELLAELKKLAETIVLDDINQVYSSNEATALCIRYSGACLSGVANFID